MEKEASCEETILKEDGLKITELSKIDSDNFNLTGYSMNAAIPLSSFSKEHSLNQLGIQKKAWFDNHLDYERQIPSGSPGNKFPNDQKESAVSDKKAGTGQLKPVTPLQFLRFERTSKDCDQFQKMKENWNEQQKSGSNNDSESDNKQNSSNQQISTAKNNNEIAASIPKNSSNGNFQYFSPSNASISHFSNSFNINNIDNQKSSLNPLIINSELESIQRESSSSSSSRQTKKNTIIIKAPFDSLLQPSQAFEGFPQDSLQLPDHYLNFKLPSSNNLFAQSSALSPKNSLIYMNSLRNNIHNHNNNNLNGFFNVNSLNDFQNLALMDSLRQYHLIPSLKSDNEPSNSDLAAYEKINEQEGIQKNNNPILSCLFSTLQNNNIQTNVAIEEDEDFEIEDKNHKKIKKECAETNQQHNDTNFSNEGNESARSDLINAIEEESQSHSISNKKNSKQQKNLHINQSKQNEKKGKKSSSRQSQHKNVYKNFGKELLRYVRSKRQTCKELNSEEFEQLLHQLTGGLNDKEMKQTLPIQKKEQLQILWTLKTFPVKSNNESNCKSKQQQQQYNKKIKDQKEPVDEMEQFITESDEILQTDAPEIKAKKVFRKLSWEFFDQWAYQYVMTSRKLDKKEIHLKCIPSFLFGIIAPKSLEVFRPIREQQIHINQQKNIKMKINEEEDEVEEEDEEEEDEIK